MPSAAGKNPDWNFILKNKVRKYLIFRGKIGFEYCSSSELICNEAQRFYRIQVNGNGRSIFRFGVQVEYRHGKK